MESEHDEGSQDQKSMNVIRVEYDESYENLAVSSPDPLTSNSATKGKYYKQTYRPAWEHMPDFKGNSNIEPFTIMFKQYNMQFNILIIIFQ